uniref:Uncharacterized protein n=1 Tax=Sphaerodactylus townsendi TaxID=933632 RepID=A0ACB8EE17_9SAUR
MTLLMGPTGSKVGVYMAKFPASLILCHFKNSLIEKRGHQSDFFFCLQCENVNSYSNWQRACGDHEHVKGDLVHYFSQHEILAREISAAQWLILGRCYFRCQFHLPLKIEGCCAFQGLKNNNASHLLVLLTI